MSGPTKYNARDQIFQVQNPSDGTWVQILAGLDTFSKGRSAEVTKTTTFASQGNAEQEVMERAETMKLEGFRYKDPATGALDPGQQLVETLGRQVGTASQGGFRFAAPGDANYEVWAAATVEMGDEGGGNNDKVSWSATFTRSGPTTTAARP